MTTCVDHYLEEEEGEEKKEEEEEEEEVAICYTNYLVLVLIFKCC